MAFSAPPPPPSSSNAAAGSEASRKAVSLFKNAAKRKHSFIQFFAMTGILLVSVRSLGQKYRLHDLQEDTYALKGEQEAFTKRMNHIKSSLLHEASLDSTGLFASRLRALFGEDHQGKPSRYQSEKLWEAAMLLDRLQCRAFKGQNFISFHGL